MKRRHVIQSLVVGGAVSMAGCSAVQRGTEEARLADLSIVNLPERTHQLELQVERDGELVYSEVHEAPLTEDDEEIRTIRDERPSEAGKFAVRARIEGGEEWETREYPLEDREGSCYSIIIRIRTDGAIDIPSITDEELC